jgi:hypothetical protein
LEKESKNMKVVQINFDEVINAITTNEQELANLYVLEFDSNMFPEVTRLQNRSIETLMKLSKRENVVFIKTIREE